MLIAGGQSGEIIKNGKVVKQYQQVDTDLLIYCWRHPIVLTSDWKNPNEEDKKKLETIKLKECEAKNEYGKLVKARFCPKCYQTVFYTKPI